MSGMYGWTDEDTHTHSLPFLKQLRVLLFCHCLLSYMYAAPSRGPHLTNHLVNAHIIDLLHIHIQ